ncbi:MAG: hypothetical protein BWY59_00807 [Verrucomicrobia bacterium ADurb.Bin345]|nr:MAG: hypothetical protein BWY59_00807 [Verrucomicrobia bacterium ADurb.Bin345]
MFVAAVTDTIAGSALGMPGRIWIESTYTGPAHTSRFGQTISMPNSSTSRSTSYGSEDTSHWITFHWPGTRMTSWLMCA